MRGRPGQRRLELRSGRVVGVRPIRPEDAVLLARSFERLSPESRYRRFLAPISRLTGSQLRYLTELDHHDHEALVALDDAGELVGVARYVRLRGEEDVADVAVTVADDWQGQGLGGALLDALVRRARDEGVQSFDAEVLRDNVGSLKMLERLGPSERSDDGPTAHLRIPLPEEGVGTQLAHLLRSAAAGSMVVAGAAVLRAAGTARSAPALPPPDPDRAVRVVVVGTDGSPAATACVRTAVQLALAVGARVHLVSSYNRLAPPVLHRSRDWLPDEVSGLGWLLSGRGEAERALQAAVAAAGAGEVALTTEAREGDPADALISVAEAEAADLIVVGAQGMRGPTRYLLGSVAAKVARHAPCSVLIARP